MESAIFIFSAGSSPGAGKKATVPLGYRIDMSRYFAISAQILIDFFLLSAAFSLAFLFRFEFSLSPYYLKLLFFTLPYVVILQYLFIVLMGVHRLSWQYISLKDTSRIIAAAAGASMLLVIMRLLMPEVGGTGYARYVTLPLGILAIDFVLAFLFITGVRLLRRSIAEREERGRQELPSGKSAVNTLLIGAGRAGVLVAKEVQQNPHLGMRIAGFLDDDPKKIGTYILGNSVLGATSCLESIVQKHHVKQAVITIAAARGADIRRIVSLCETAKLPVKIIPGLYEILDGRVKLSRIRSVEIDDLLGREAVDLDIESIGIFLKDKCVLVTGAGGSIGAELCRQVMRYAPRSLILLEQAENPLFLIHKELESAAGDTTLVPCIADICDADRVRAVFASQKPQVVFHAAAHKHVPMMEWNPGEAVKNNVFGTKNIADAADAFGTEAFVMISTDKAVNPTSVMGTTKRVAELYVQALAKVSRTKFTAVRFGNVLGSAGSVIPIFKEQIKNGGPVTVTHPEMQRYFMTIPESCRLVIQAAVLGRGGEIFVLDMGEPIKIVDLARDLIRLSGFGQDEIAIEFTGIRPGEKLFEELSTSAERMTKTHHPKIFIGKFEAFPMEKIIDALSVLSSIAESASPQGIRHTLSTLVPEMSLSAEEGRPFGTGAESTAAGR